MSHPSTGFFYCRYTYTAYWDSSEGVGFDDDFHTAYYTPARKDHQEQTNWYRDKFLPAAEADCVRIINRYHRNLKGRLYRPFDSKMIKVQEFMWTKSLPVHSDGPHKGLPFGRQI